MKKASIANSETQQSAVAEAQQSGKAVLKRVCEQSLLRGQKRKINLVARDTWLPEYLHFPELDADTYSRNGHPPKKLIYKKSTKEMEIRGWRQTPCRYGMTCRGLKRGYCFFIHTSSQNEVEIAAGSALRLRQIQRAIETVQVRKQKKTSSNKHGLGHMIFSAGMYGSQHDVFSGASL